MVIYEVLSGQKPFSEHEGYDIIVRIHRGERPARPRGAAGRWFTGDIWDTLEHSGNAAHATARELKMYIVV